MSERRMQKRHRVLALVYSMLLTVGASSAFGSMILPQTMRSMAAGSEEVVRATVLQMESRWNADKTSIETDIWLAVSDTYKGKAEGEIVLTVPGGRVDDLIAHVVGAPRFSIDEEVVVFLVPRVEGGYRIFNLMLGKYDVASEPSGKSWVSNPQYSLASLLPTKAVTLDSAGRLSLSVFTRELQREVSSENGESR